MAAGRVVPKAIVGLFLFAALSAGHAQDAPTKLEFDVASIRQNVSGLPPAGDKPGSNEPLGPGDVHTANDGILHAKNFPLLTYIDFAYRLTDYQEAALRTSAPAWVTDERFDIEARTDNHAVTKDQMRLMMRSLLAERFGLVVRSEMRLAPVYVLLPVKAGAMGTKLQAHPADAVCWDYDPKKFAPDGEPKPKAPETVANGFPGICGGILGLSASARDRYALGARKVPLAIIAKSLSSWGNLGRPVVDETGLPGDYDFVLEFTPDPPPAYAAGVDSGGPSFQEALKQQLGFRLEAQKREVQFYLVEHVERLKAN